MMETPNPALPPAAPPALVSPPASAVAVDHVIEYAWYRCNAYDERSNDLKRRYRRIRESIIILTWFTTLLAVLAALASFDNVISLLQFGTVFIPLGYLIVTTPYYEMRTFGLLALVKKIGENLRLRLRAILSIIAVFLLAMAIIWLTLWWIPAELNRRIFYFTLIILPLLSTYLLNHATRFEAGHAWVGFRDVAEAIRRKIYETRVLASLRPLTEADLEELRTLVIEQSRKPDEMSIVTPVWGKPYTPGSAATGRMKPLWTNDDSDDGYSPLCIDEYVRWRLVHQTNYYHGRIQKDWNKTREFRALILFVSGLGAFLAAADYGHFVAVTVAGVTALQAWLSLREHEISYSIHQRTRKQLEDRIASYYIVLKKIGDREVKSEADRQAIMSFVDSVEDVLDDERAAWQAAVLQSQESAESALTQLVTSGKPDDWKIERDEEGYLRVVVPERQTRAEAPAETAAAQPAATYTPPAAEAVAAASFTASTSSEIVSPNGAFEAQVVDFADDDDISHALSEVDSLEAQTVDFDQDDDHTDALSEVDSLEAQTVDFEDDDHTEALSEVAGDVDGSVAVVGANGSSNDSAAAPAEDEELVAPG